MTHSALIRHYCKFTVIDLTNETDDDETVVDLTVNEQQGP